ncbi:hypothetical protein [Psychroserpens luteus]|uniref:Uncharacterized protein n=1 Tax=Psychroserpens luteus TaxID=1434066 RepID=A0ABW5ZVL5_9FLAO|nr:hypothetical protein [Psychroserpens luteus]
MSTEIKNTLFRFVSMRAPELTDDNKSKDGFIFRDDTVKKGDFDAAITNLTAGTSKWQALKTAANSFTALSADNIKKIDSKLYELSIWIAKNRLSFKTEELLERAQGIGAIEDKDVLGRLWDNLFYQTVTQKEFYAKETIIQLLIANHLLSNFKGDKEQIKALINAKVVLPKPLFGEGETDNANAKKASTKETQAFSSVPTIVMAKQQSIAQAEFHNQQLSLLSKELKRAEKSYQKEKSSALEAAEKNYQKEIKPILDQYASDVEVEKVKWCEIKDPNVDYDPNDPCNQPNMVSEPELPEFVFDFRPELDFKFLEAKLSAESFETLSSLVALDSNNVSEKSARLAEPEFDTFSENYEGFADVDGFIQDVISGNDDTIVDNTEEEGHTLVSVGGVLIPVDTSNSLPNFSYQLCSKSIIKPPFGLKFNADLSIVVPDTSWQVANFDYTLERTDQDYSNNGASSYSVIRFGNTIFLRNINIGWPFITEQSQLESFSGTITFTNGVVKTFSTPDFILRTCTSGTLIGDIVDPNDGDDSLNPGTTNETPFVPSGFGVKQLGIADYNKVEQSTQGYVEGDVAHIENIMAREFKERSTRRLRSKEETFTSSSESEREQLSDTTSTERFEMQNEVSKVIANSTDFGASANVQYTGLAGKLILNAGASFASHNSKEESTRQAVTNSKDITERALDRIVSKVKEERIEKIVEEFEENNSHGFDNRKGDKHVVGVFRWVDKIFKNQIVNYGKRLMFEFMVPQPGKLHKLGMIGNNEDNNMLVEPVDPRKSTSFKLKDFSELTDTNLKYWSSKYNVEFTPMRKLNLSVSKGFDGNNTTTGYYTSGKGEIRIPEGYEVNKAKASLSYDFHPSGIEASGVTINIGDKYYNKQWSSHFNEERIDFNNLGGIQQELAVAYKAFDCGTFSMTVVAECSLTSEAKQIWKQETFKSIIDAYEDALATYNEKLAVEKVNGIQIKGTNPGFYREFENKILRKNCISYLIDQDPSAKNTYGKSNMFTTNGGGTQNFSNLEVNVNEALDNYVAFVKFMEQAFEWDIMSYNLYPYYWGNRQDWSSLYQFDESNDPLFRNFMQAGMARVIITVRPGFEEAVRYYMQTGQIWNGGEVPVIEDELYLSLIDELRQPEGEKLGKAWPTRVPTALTILQAQSIGLNVTKALPSIEDLSDFENPDEVPQSQELDLNDAEIGGSEDDEVRHIENIDIVNGNLQLNTDTNPRQIVAQISIEALKNAIDDVV